MSEEGAEREAGRESQAGSVLRAQRALKLNFTKCEIMT